MLCCCDRTGFPLLRLQELDLEAALLPGTKKQFELFLAGPQSSFGDAWYEEVLAVNPRASWRNGSTNEREQLFLTGVLPEEVLAFARWLGPDFDLPSADERRILDGLLRSQPIEPAALTHGLADGAPAARAMVERFLGEVKPRTWGELALLRGGVVEWVREGGAFAGLGAPRPEFWPNHFNPGLRDELVWPFPGRLRFFGFRLVRRIGPAARR